MEIKVIFDINIWLDIAARPNLYPDSILLFNKLVKTSRIGLPLSGYTTLYYLLCKSLGSKPANDFLSLLKKQSIDFVDFVVKDIELAVHLGFKDLEDACLAASAIRNGYSHIVTRNIKDFKLSPIPAVEPKKFLLNL